MLDCYLNFFHSIDRWYEVYIRNFEFQSDMHDNNGIMLTVT